MGDSLVPPAAIERSLILSLPTHVCVWVCCTQKSCKQSWYTMLVYFGLWLVGNAYIDDADFGPIFFVWPRFIKSVNATSLSFLISSEQRLVLKKAPGRHKNFIAHLKKKYLGTKACLSKMLWRLIILIQWNPYYLPMNCILLSLSKVSCLAQYSCWNEANCLTEYCEKYTTCTLRIP